MAGRITWTEPLHITAHAALPIYLIAASAAKAHHHVVLVIAEQGPSNRNGAGLAGHCSLVFLINETFEFERIIMSIT